MAVSTSRVRRAILGVSVAAFSLGVIGSSTTAIMASGSHAASTTMTASHRYGD
jgi:hypothetical protein